MTSSPANVHETVAAPAPQALSARGIVEADIDSAVAVLTRGFPERSEAYWRRGFERLRHRPVPDGRPRFGFILVDGERTVGILLLIFSQTDEGRTIANVSSWYVEPAYRGYSSFLLAFAFRLKDVVLFNVSPTPRTIATIEAQGFRRYCAGTFHALAWLAPPVADCTVREIAGGVGTDKFARLAAWGCLAFEVVYADEVHVFVFLRRRFAHDRLPTAHLVYASDIATFVRFAGPLGRRLARRGFPSVMIDANGPVAGLHGRFITGRRIKYFRGIEPPPQNDLTETELVIFGP